jgi:hypothetical protein
MERKNKVVMRMSTWTTAGKILAALGIGTVIVAQALPISPEWRSFGNAIGVALTAMSAYLMHDGIANGETQTATPAKAA